MPEKALGALNLPSKFPQGDTFVNGHWALHQSEDPDISLLLSA